MRADWQAGRQAGGQAYTDSPVHAEHRARFGKPANHSGFVVLLVPEGRRTLGNQSRHRTISRWTYVMAHWYAVVA